MRGTGEGTKRPRRIAAGRARLLDVERHVDDRGALVPVRFDDVDFPVARAFVVTAADGSVRGGHAHARSRQLLLRVSGVIRVELRTSAGVDTVELDEGAPALLIEPGVWASQTYLGADAALVVFSDSDYDADDYVPSFTDLDSGRGDA